MITMARIENQFIPMDDNTLKSVMDDYEKWREDGSIPKDGFLAKARDKYREAYDAHGLALMEKELLYACTLRWLALVNK